LFLVKCSVSGCRNCSLWAVVVVVPGVAVVGAWPDDWIGGRRRRCPLVVLIDATSAPWL
jgi:hypothetical protein